MARAAHGLQTETAPAKAHCSGCGHEGPADARFCANCGTPIASPPTTLVQRKVVTVVFCDVADSTALGESIDAEALRDLLARYFANMKSIVEAHGGTVEKFIGDAVMAIFGVPHVHEDDALRAVRAAIEMRDAAPSIGIQVRIGVNTGEVVTGTSERLATGDAVNVAARLEQVAAPQEILIGGETRLLVRDVVDAEAAPPLVLKGKAAPFTAYRLRAVTGSPARRNDAPLVGRRSQLKRLRATYEQARRDRQCHMVTILGEPGVGKSRLLTEFLSGAAATVVVGHCRSYGAGITYLPLSEATRQLLSVRPSLSLDVVLRELLEADRITASSADIARSFRQLLERAAHEAPLVVVFEDLHWAEQAFLDVVEHLTDQSRDAAILVLCTARPELRERRPRWGSTRHNVKNLRLDALSDAQALELLGSVTSGLSDTVQRRIVDAAEGNPLFVEEMAALVVEAGDDKLSVPPTIHALLAARIEQLDEPERAVLECASVEGHLFHRGAVAALCQGGSELKLRLATLVRKNLVRPDAAQGPDGDAYRFRHQLIRDAAYGALPKKVRADLHELCAGWLEQAAATPSALDELLGYHLAETCRYRLELGELVDERVARKARGHLSLAGRHAFMRGDYHAAAGLLERAQSLPGARDVALEMDIVENLQLAGDLERATEAAQRHLSQAATEVDRRVELCAQITLEYLNSCLGALTPERQRALINESLPDFEAANDHAALYVAYFALGMGCEYAVGHYAAAEQAVERAAAHAQAIGSPIDCFGMRLFLQWLGPSPISDGLAWVEREMGARLDARSFAGRTRALLLAQLGRIDEARKVLATELTQRELDGEGTISSDYWMTVNYVEGLAGNNAAQVAAAQEMCRLDARQLATLAWSQVVLALSLCRAGRYVEAEAWADKSAEFAGDFFTGNFWRRAKALALAHEGKRDEALSLGREALRLARETHSPVFIGDSLFDLGEVLECSGLTGEAVDTYLEALQVFRRKENLVMADRTQARLERLGTAALASDSVPRSAADRGVPGGESPGTT